MLSYLGAAAQSYTNGDGSVLRSWTGKDAGTFRTLCAFLEAQGYTSYSSHAQNGSLFATYCRGSELFHIYYLADTGRLCAVTSDTAAATLPVPVPTGGSEPVTITQLCLPISSENVYSNGMGYVVRLSDGSFLIWDGGYPGQADQLWQTLVSQNGGEQGICIRAWVITHAHADHYSCLSAFAERYAGRVTLERFLVAPLNRTDAADPFLHTSLPGVAARFEGAQVCVLHTGMRFSWCGLTLEVLLSPEELYINGGVADFNNSSVITRLSDGSDSILFLGDALHEVTDRLTALYGDTLRANQVQVAHHGVGDSDAAFYHSLGASTLWYPCGERLYSWTVEFADNIARNGAVRRELAESGLYEILLHDATAYQRVWGSAEPAQPFDPGV